jgi:hypothetical protein
MERLLALQAFAREVEPGGFTKAGDSLQLSKTTVSDLVQGIGAALSRGFQTRAAEIALAQVLGEVDH